MARNCGAAYGAGIRHRPGTVAGEHRWGAAFSGRLDAKNRCTVFNGIATAEFQVSREQLLRAVDRTGGAPALPGIRPALRDDAGCETRSESSTEDGGRWCRPQQAGRAPSALRK